MIGHAPMKIVGAGDDNPEVVTVPPHRAASAARAFRPFRRKGLFFPSRRGD
jgi:hypothetical protein